MFRLQNNVPQTYIEQSRDFQLLCRLYDSINNGVRFDINTITNVLNPLKINDRAIQLLATRVGFNIEEETDTNLLRYILSAFSYALKYKGTKRGINYIVSAALKAEHSNHPPIIDIVNESLDEKGNEKPDHFTIAIHLPVKIDTSTQNTLLEALKYVIPTGYLVSIDTYYSEGRGDRTTELYDYYTVAAIHNLPIYINSGLRGDSDLNNTLPEAPTWEEENLINSFDTTEVVSFTDYKKSFDKKALTKDSTQQLTKIYDIDNKAGNNGN